MPNTLDVADLAINHLADLAFSDSPSIYNKGQSLKGNSIKTRTKNLIMQFPLLISETISIETAEILAEGFERENAILVKLLLQNDLGSLTGTLDTDDLSVSGMLKSIHTNIDANMLNESKNMIEENLKQLIPIEDKFNKYSINEGTLPKYLREDSMTVDEKTKNVREMRKELKNNTDIGFKNDQFEKINKLVPTFINMKLSTLIRSGKKSERGENNILFGVKCVVHPLKSDDIIHNITIGFKNSTLFKLVKWTTGEYSFFKGIGEIVFDYSRMRELGIQASKQSNYWWFKLKKLKNSNQAKFFAFSKKPQPTKTATLILSKDEVDIIERDYRIDIKQCKIANKILKELFLLNFGYVDESTEVVYLYDEVSNTYIVKKLDDFKSKSKSKAISVEDIKSLFGR